MGEGNSSEPALTDLKAIRRKPGVSPNEAHDLRAKILDLAARNLSYDEIAQLAGTSKSTVARVIQKFKTVFKHLPNVAEFRNIKADILSASQMAGLESAFSGNKLQKASFLSTIQAVKELNTMERLERNLSTENISHHKVHTHLSVNKLEAVDQPIETIEETKDTEPLIELTDK